jgi:hypothetical protein
MSIFKTLPIIKIINGLEVKTSEAVVVSNDYYSTNGESVVVVKELILDKISTIFLLYVII